MKHALIYDTETSGLPLYHEPSEDPRQPHIVQLAAVLVDLDTRATVSSMNVIVRPDGWVIPDDVAQVHGITTERAADLGIPEELALSMFMQLWNQRLRIAHNESFDARIIRIAQHRFPLAYPETRLIAWKEGQAECTARLATPICALPPTEKMKAAKRFHHKTPNLQEAYRHFMGEDFDGAHSAMADVQACRAVYFAIHDMKKEVAA